MMQKYKASSILTLALIFLTPLFFIPGGALYVDSAKSGLFIIGLVLLALAYLVESYKQGVLSFPKHYFVIVVGLLPLVYLISALLTTPSSLSLLGYNLEVGTFGFILLGSTALLLTASFYAHITRFLQALVALFASLSLLALFVLVKIITGGDWLVLNNFFGNMANPLGNWTDLAIAFGLLALLSALSLGMLPMRALIRTLVYVVFVLSTFLLVIINFSTAFIMTLGASVLLFFYFFKVERHFLFHSKDLDSSGEAHEKRIFSRATALPLFIALVSLLMLINPTLSETKGNLGNVISGTFGIENTDVRPSFMATLGISKAVLSQESLLGSGPNTFGQDWLIFKPQSVNTTPFWAFAFPFGVGFIPTQVATTGILGSIVWLAFFVFLFILTFKTVSAVPESRALRFTLISTLSIALFLWISSLLYAPSGAMLLLAFIFAGLFTALSREAGVISSYSVDLKGRVSTRFASLILMTLFGVGALYLGFIGGEKTLAAFHFKKAVDMANVQGTPLESVEKELSKAVALDPVDIYYNAVSRLNFSKAQAAAAATTGEPQENQKMFEDGLRLSIEAARQAVDVNPASYGNWVALGNIYGALVPAPLRVEGAYDNAKFAYGEAQKRNPNNPELPLLLAQLEVANGDVEAARSYIRNSIALKEDYADAYLFLAQLEVQSNNIPEAIESAEALAVLVPNNPGIHFELGLLKYSLNDFQGAAESLAEAVRLSPQYANAKYYLGFSYSKLGRPAGAKNQFEDLLVTNPDSPEVHDALEKLNSGKPL